MNWGGGNPIIGYKLLNASAGNGNKSVTTPLEPKVIIFLSYGSWFQFSNVAGSTYITGVTSNTGRTTEYTGGVGNNITITKNDDGSYTTKCTQYDATLMVIYY